MTNIVELKNLTVNYKPNKEVDKQLIHGIDINFRKGQITGVVGESGSGKSILMRSIMSILPNNIFDKNDKFIFDGKEVKKGEKLPISMIFQNPMTSLDPVRTIGFHLIEVIERFQNKSKEEAKKLAIEQLEKVGILNAPLRMEQYPHELSGGMRQRILIAMALLANPKLLVADEPTTALDVTVQAQILSLIKKLQKETELSVALVSHDFGVIAGMCDYVYIMYRGRVVEKGNVEEIFSNAQHPYTKQLLAAARLENTNNELLTVDYKEDDKHYTWQKLSDTHEYLKEVE
jgi:oligopeptide transport ATP-binding protein OppD